MAFHDEILYPCNRAGVPDFYRGIQVVAARDHDNPGLVAYESVDASGNKEVMYTWLDGDGNLRYSTTLPTNQDTGGVIFAHAAPQIQIKKIDITANVTGEQTGLWTIPDPSIIWDVFIKVTTIDAGETMDIGTDGAGSNDPDGFSDGISIGALGIVRGIPTYTVGGNETYFASSTVGDLLAPTQLAGSNAVEDTGTYYENRFAVIAGVAALTYTPSGTPSTMRGSIYAVYTDLS